MTQSSFRRKEFLSAYSWAQSINEVKAGTQAQREPEAGAAGCWLAISACFLIKSRTASPGVALPTPSSVLLQEPRECTTDMLTGWSGGEVFSIEVFYYNMTRLCKVALKAHEQSGDGADVDAEPQICPLPSAEAQNCSGHLRAPCPGHTGDQEMHSQAPGELEGLLPSALTLWSHGGPGMELVYTTGCHVSQLLGVEAWLLYMHQGKDETLS